MTCCLIQILTLIGARDVAFDNELKLEIPEGENIEDLKLKVCEVSRQMNLLMDCPCKNQAKPMIWVAQHIFFTLIFCSNVMYNGWLRKLIESSLTKQPNFSQK